MARASGSYKGGVQMIRWGRVQPSCPAATYRGRGEGAVTGQDNRKHRQEEYTHQQMKTDFQTKMKINVRCPRIENILFSHLPGLGEGILPSTFIPPKMSPFLQTWCSWIWITFLPGFTRKSRHSGFLSSDLDRVSSWPLLLCGLFSCLLMGAAGRPQEGDQVGI